MKLEVNRKRLDRLTRQLAASIAYHRKWRDVPVKEGPRTYWVTVPR